MTIVATPETRVVDAGRRRSADECFGLLCIYPVETSAGLIEIAGPVTRIGRDPGCDVALDGEGISAEHALIECADGQCWIRDCQSTQGTFVNDQRISAHRLNPGDRIRLGNRIFRFLTAHQFDAQYHEAVYEMMTVDALTGAQNRRYFEDAFAREVLRAQRHWRPIALLMLDIDHFRRINEQLGRAVGDECLSGFSRRVCSRIRGEDLFGRIGGEQFAITLTEAPLKQSVRVAQDLRRLIEGESFPTSHGSVTLTISIGVGFANGQGPVTPHEIVKQAYDNMRRAKSDGRNCVRY